MSPNEAFYKWSERDFIRIPAYELQVGDEVSYPGGPNLTYGAIPIEDVTIVPGAGVLLQYVLPVGAFAQSTTSTEIAVFWEEEKVLVQICQHLKYMDWVLIRRK